MSRVRAGAIDCGTNTLRLLIADVEVNGGPRPQVRDVVRRMETVRLGEGVDATGHLSEAALDRTERVLIDYARQLREHDVRNMRMVATSAVRDADNQDAFLALVQRHLPVSADVVSGDDEAALTAGGVTSGLGIDVPSLILDIGGGSTEFILDTGTGAPSAISTDVGVVRLTERHLRHDPPTSVEADAVRRDTFDVLDEVRARLGALDGLRLVGVAGTVTTAVGIALGLDTYDRSAIHGATVSRAQIELVERWALERDGSARAEHPVMHPGRAPVFAAGMLILVAIIDSIGAPSLTASEADILDGIVLKLAAAQS